MIVIGSDLAEKIVGGNKSVDNFYNEVLVPGASIGGAAVAGAGGGLAGVIIVYGIEGFISSAPDAMKALEQLNQLSENDIAARFANPYGYPD